MLLALMLSTTILFFASEFYVNYLKTIAMQNTKMSLQEKMDLASAILTDEIKNAGYTGCALHQLPIEPLLIFDHAIVVSHASKEHSTVLSDMQTTTIMTVDNAEHFEKEDWLVIADCKHAEIFQVSYLYRYENSQMITTSHPLHVLFQEGAEVSHLNTNKFFIDKNNLIMEDIHHQKNTLIDGISNLAFQRNQSLILIAIKAIENHMEKTVYVHVKTPL